MWLFFFALLFILLNSGSTTQCQFTDFTKIEANSTAIALSRCQIQVEDLNYDGKKDLLAGNGLTAASRIYFYENTGTNASPVLASAVELQQTNGSAIDPSYDVRFCFTDWNEDGGLDVVWTEYSPDDNVHIYLGEVPSEISDQNSISQLNTYPKSIVTNGQLLFNLKLGKEQNIDLRLFAVNGTIVETIEKGRLDAGERKIKMDIGKHPVGIYFLHYRVDNRDLRQRIVLVK